MDDTVLRLKNFNSSVETKVKKIVNYVQKGQYMKRFLQQLPVDAFCSEDGANVTLESD